MSHTSTTLRLSNWFRKQDLLYAKAGETAVGDILFLPYGGWFDRTREGSPLDSLLDHPYLVLDVFRSDQANPGLDRVWVPVVRQPRHVETAQLSTNLEVIDFRHGQSDLRPAESSPYPVLSREDP